MGLFPGGTGAPLDQPPDQPACIDTRMSARLSALECCNRAGESPLRGVQEAICAFPTEDREALLAASSRLATLFKLLHRLLGEEPRCSGPEGLTAPGRLPLLIDGALWGVSLLFQQQLLRAGLGSANQPTCVQHGPKPLALHTPTHNSLLPCRAVGAVVGTGLVRELAVWAARAARASPSEAKVLSRAWCGWVVGGWVEEGVEGCPLLCGCAVAQAPCLL